MQLIHILHDIFNVLYPLIGIFSLFIGLKAKYDQKKAEDNQIIYQIKLINDTLKEHNDNDKQIRNAIENIKQEQNEQNISITKLDTKLDIFCKDSKINNCKNNEYE